MTDLGFTPREDDVTRALHVLYAAPANESYWNGLEARILARVAQAGYPSAWWAEMPHFARPALVAAAALIVAAGAALVHARQLEARDAYATVISAAPVEAAARAASTDIADLDVAMTVASSP
jgi:hypothetical protein